MKPDTPPRRPGDNPADLELVREVGRHAGRHRRWQHEGPPTLLKQLSTVGVLGWIIVLPMLLGLAAGRWLDHRLGGGITFTAALLLLGLGLGAWAAWRWMHEK